MSIRSTQKKRGRPATGQAPRFSIRLPDEVHQAVRRWADDQLDSPQFSAAVRMLVTGALINDGYLKPGEESLRPNQLNAENDG